MQILLAPSKTMINRPSAGPGVNADLSPCPSSTNPRRWATACTIARELSDCAPDQLATMLRCSPRLAAAAHAHYQRIALSAPNEGTPALWAYRGTAYRHLDAPSLTTAEAAWAAGHLWIASYLYGLLRPTDSVLPHRMEAGITLSCTGGKSLAEYWRDALTDELITAVRADDGILLHLATEEFQHLFHWRRVEASVRIVKPLFYVERNGHRTIQAVWAKTGRGAMARHAIHQHHCSSPETLATFSYAGFTLDPDYHNPDFPKFVRPA